MKIKITQKHLDNFIKVGLIICVIAIIIQLFPTENKFKYHFEIGKPWSYELITASFDFPIYKNEEIILKETAELLKNYAPYYVIDTTMAQKQFEKLAADYQKANEKPIEHAAFLKNKLNQIYSKGVITAEDLSELNSEARTKIHYILPNRLTRQIPVDELYTPKTAYEEILKGAPEEIKVYNLNVYLVENLKYDTATSNVAKNDLLKSLSLTSGMIQSGERIIDRGEIVTPESYAALNSLKIEYQKRKSSLQQSSLVIIGEIIIISALVALFFLYLNLFRPRIFDSFGNLLFISLLILIITGLASVTVRYTAWNYFMIPFALLPIIIRVFFDSRTALFAHIITVLIISFMVDNSFRFVVLQIAVGMAAVSSLKDMTQRSQLAQTALYIFLSYVGLYLAFEFISEGELKRIHWLPVLYFGVSSAFLLLAYILIYIFEKIFGLISAVTLVELTNVTATL